MKSPTKARLHKYKPTTVVSKFKVTSGKSLISLIVSLSHSCVILMTKPKRNNILNKYLSNILLFVRFAFKILIDKRYRIKVNWPSSKYFSFVKLIIWTRNTFEESLKNYSYFAISKDCNDWSELNWEVIKANIGELMERRVACFCRPPLPPCGLKSVTTTGRRVNSFQLPCRVPHA